MDLLEGVVEDNEFVTLNVDGRLLISDEGTGSGKKML